MLKILELLLYTTDLAFFLVVVCLLSLHAGHHHLNYKEKIIDTKQVKKR